MRAAQRPLRPDKVIDRLGTGAETRHFARGVVALPMGAFALVPAMGAVAQHAGQILGGQVPRLDGSRKVDFQLPCNRPDGGRLRREVKGHLHTLRVAERRR